MPTEYNITKIQLPNGDVCKLPNKVKYIDITKSGSTYSLPSGTTYASIKALIDADYLCVVRVDSPDGETDGKMHLYLCDYLPTADTNPDHGWEQGLYFQSRNWGGGDFYELVIHTDSSVVLSQHSGGGGNYISKVSSTDNAIVRFDGTLGDVQNSGVIIDDNNNVKIPAGSNASAYQNPKLEIGGKIWMGTGSSGGIVFGGISGNSYSTYYTFDPTALRVTTANSGVISLGTSAQKWKDLYMTGNLYGASNSIAVDTLISNSHTHSNKTVLDYIPNSLGTAGQIIAVNSGATGLEWKTPLTIGTTATTAAAGNHKHGNITNGGDITATGVTIANGDALVIRDSSASKLAKTSITFDGSTTNQFLSKKGTWQTAGLSITVVKDLMSYDDYLTATSSYDWSYSSFYLWKCSGYGSGPDSSSYIFEEAYYVVNDFGGTPKLMHLDNEEISGESGMAINWSWTETRNIQDKEIIYVQNSGVYYIYNADEYKLIPLNKNTANYDLIYDGNRIIDAECIDWPLIYGNSYNSINESLPSSITLNIGSYMSMGYGTIGNNSANTIHTLILCNTSQSDCAITVSPTPNVSSGLTNSSFTIPGNGIAELSVAVYTNGIGNAEYSLIVKTDFD